MLSVVSNVQYNTIAREWRCKWDSDESLIESQNALTDVLDKVKSVDGVRDVQRVVCGGCKDFKVRWVWVWSALAKFKLGSSASLNDGLWLWRSIFWMCSIFILVSNPKTSHPLLLLLDIDYSFDWTTHIQVIVSLDASTFAEWETTSYAPELEFLAKLRQISGVSSVETQTYTLMSMMN